MKKLIGLTGMSGSGKSAAADILRRLGCDCFDCDSIAHTALADDGVKSQIIKVFGDKVVKNGEISRKALGEIVFFDKEKLAVLNKIVHPYVINKVKMLYAASEKELCVVDGSELEASGLDLECDCVVVITAQSSIRAQRIMRRDGIDLSAAKKRMAAQTPYSKKAIVISNNSSAEDFFAAVKKLYNSLLVSSDGGLQ